MANNRKRKIVLTVFVIFSIVVVFALYEAYTFNQSFYELTNETCVEHGGELLDAHHCAYPDITDENVCRQNGGYMYQSYRPPKLDNSSTNENESIDIECTAYIGSQVRFE